MEFSVVPIFWLEEPNHCFWPQEMKNIRMAIVRGIPVQDDWIRYKCNIIGKYVTYKFALKAEKEAVASSESENEGQLRKKKLNIINIWIMSILLSLQDWPLHARNQMTQIS